MMLDEQNEISWQTVMANFFTEKFEADFSKYLKDLFKEINGHYQKDDFCDNDDIAAIFDRSNKRTEDESESSFIVEQVRRLSDFDSKPLMVNFLELNNEINHKRQELLDKFSPQAWLSWAKKKKKNVSFATHVAKLTHAAIDSSSFFDKSESIKDGYLATTNLKSAAVDGAVRGNQFAPIYQFLELELNGQKLVAQFNDRETNLLTCFTHDERQVEEWNRGFSAALDEGKPSAHSLLKQVYFPVEKERYHLLVNVVSSSKAQALFEYTRRDGDSDAVYKLRSNKKYSQKHYVAFPNRASILITASNHGNASQLNGRRGGRLGLFSCQPPIWQSKLKPPIYKQSFFFELSRNYQVREAIQYLADFLARFESLALSIKDPKRFNWIEKWVEDLTDEVIVYVKTIQALPAGWSIIDDICLKQEQQVLLDCHRNDEAFRELQRHNWQAVIVEDFANWLNYSLRKANENCTPQELHKKRWAKLFEENNRELFALEKFELQEVNA